MSKNRRICSICLVILLGCAAVLSLLGQPATPVRAGQPTAIPTKMSKTLIAAEVSQATVNPGDAFDLTITIDSDTPSWGTQLSLKFDPKLVEIDGFDTGSFYKDFAKAHNGTFVDIPQPKIDNGAGTVGATALAMIGIPAGTGGPSGKGILITFHGKAKAGAQGTALFQLGDALVSDAGDANGNTQSLGGVMLQDGVLAVGSSNPAATQAPRPADVQSGQAAAQPTAEATIAKRTSLAPTDSGGSIPWVIILPVLGLLLVGAGAAVVLKKK